MNHNIIVKDIENIRLDIFLSEKYTELSRSKLNKLIKNGDIIVNDEIVKPSYLIKYGDVIYIKTLEEKKIKLIKENIPLDIIYEDDYLMVLNKPKGLVVYPGENHENGTLVNGLLNYTDKLSDIGGYIRPGIVHRLDKDTSGLLVIAKGNKTHESLSLQLANREMKREYLLLVNGIVDNNSGEINKPIGRDPKDRLKMKVIDENSKEAITYYKVLKRYENYTYLKASLYTGRMHQIRVHMSYINHSIVGDNVYGDKKNEFNLKSQLLHSYKIGFIHPKTEKYMEFENHKSKELERVLDILDKRGIICQI